MEKILWISLLFFTIITAENSLEKFKKCHNYDCIFVQCYFPVVEFLNATRTEMKLFENFIEKHHVFIDYHLCNDLSADNLDEVGACLYGVLFKLYQFDKNLTVQQRMHIEKANIQDDSVAIVMDMISGLLYRIQSVSDKNTLKGILRRLDDEDIVVIDARNLIAQTHLEVSRTILNYGPWFSFIYSIVDNEEAKLDCLYRIYIIEGDASESQCAIQDDIQFILELRMHSRKVLSNSIDAFSDLTHINAFPRNLPVLFYMYSNSSFNLIPHDTLTIVPVNMLNFNKYDVENNVLLHGPYPFYLFWSVKKNKFQRLGDQPSTKLLDMIIQEEQDLKNEFGMFDDDVRYIADSFEHVIISPNVLFLKNQDDYHRIQESNSKLAILFTVRWDSTSKLARKTFHEIASYMNNYITMLDIDCFDWTTLCSEENILEWPILILSENKTKRKIYKGSTDKSEMASALVQFSVKQPYLIENDSIENILVRQYVIVTARIQHEEKFLYDTYKNLVDMFLDNEHIFFMFQYSTESSALIIKQKYGDRNSLLQPKTTIHTFDDNLEDLKALIINALQIPIIPFDPSDIIQSTPTTFLLASHSQLVQLNENILLNDLSKEAPLIWVDSNSVWILIINEYGYISYPAVIYVNHTNGKVYVNSNLNNISEWFKRIEMGSVKAFYELTTNDIDEKPSQKAIDFKKQMHNEEVLNEIHRIQEETEKINEHGLEKLMINPSNISDIVEQTKRCLNLHNSQHIDNNHSIPTIIPWWEKNEDENEPDELLMTSDEDLKRIVDGSMNLMLTNSKLKVEKRIQTFIDRKRFKHNRQKSRSKSFHIDSNPELISQALQNCNLVVPIESTNLGHKLLEKIGWTPGNGLGLNQNGIKTPIEVNIRSRRQGLGYEKLINQSK